MYMKELINEELNYMKYLFGYQRGKVVSEQSTITTTTTTQSPITSGGESECQSEEYWDGTKCVKIPKGSIVTTDPKEYEALTKRYNDELFMYNSTYNLLDAIKKNKKNISDYQSINLRFNNIDKYNDIIPLYNKTQNQPLSGGRNQPWRVDYYKKPNKIILGYNKEKPVIPTVKIENINQITKVEDFPKDFVLSGDYRCSGTNSLGYKSQPSTFEQQCMDLPSSMKTFDKLSAWEIKFPPNVAGNPKTVPVTRWDFIWDSQGKIKEIKMQNFNKIGKEEQVVYDNLLSQKSSDENLKAFMKIAYGSDDNYNERVGNLLI